MIMDRIESIYHEAAVRLIEERGPTDALLEAMRCRDMSPQGTASYMFHSAVVRIIRALNNAANA